MRHIPLLLGITFFVSNYLAAQQGEADARELQEIEAVVNSYSQARTGGDSLLLSQILTAETDQLVSSGVWRKGKEEAMRGMGRSSENNPGTRTLEVEQIRLLTSDCAIADARYEIKNEDGTERKMWSTFLLVRTPQGWKISAIRNMLPARATN
jgi:uncharacterized protein (TIGR02246 family)